MIMEIVVAIDRKTALLAAAEVRCDDGSVASRTSAGAGRSEH